MKVSFEISDMQVLKVCALCPATDEQTEAVMAAVHETPELDLTAECRENQSFSLLAHSVCAYAVAVIVDKKKKEIE